MMIRAGIVSTFLCVTLGTWVWVKPPSDAPVTALFTPASDAPTPQTETPLAPVRGASVMAALVPTAAPLADTANTVENTIAPAPEAQVTRAQTPQISPAPAEAIPAVPSAFADAEALEGVVTIVLDGMGFGSDDPALRELAQGALSDIRGVTGSGPEADSAFAEMILVALVTGWDDAQIADTVRTAHQTGEITVPLGVMTTNGLVDMPTVLAGLLSRARAAVGQADALPVAQVSSYVVRPGDSLAAIAAQVYGDMTAYAVIAAANEDILSDPAALQPGQTLLIPPL